MDPDTRESAKNTDRTDALQKVAIMLTTRRLKVQHLSSSYLIRFTEAQNQVGAQAQAARFACQSPLTSTTGLWY
ncbi:hypothetical protein KCU81_g436, partial [Aureobasidium melanogenum]